MLLLLRLSGVLLLLIPYSSACLATSSEMSGSGSSNSGSGSGSSSGSGSFSACPSSWSLFQGNCYYVGYNKTWYAAESDCVSLGGHLASIHTHDENNFIQMITTTGTNQHTSTGMTWFGLQRYGSGIHDFNYTDGTAYNYNNWNTGEPNDSTPACVQLYSDNDLFGSGIGYWSDTSCTNFMKFVCKKSST